MEGYVYLIGEEETEGLYKIGSTRAKDVNSRLKQLQTGNPKHLFIKHYFKTDKPFKLEKLLHMRFKPNNVMGEWFELQNDDIDNFNSICENLQNIIDSLKHNPFFNKKTESVI